MFPNGARRTGSDGEAMKGPVPEYQTVDIGDAELQYLLYDGPGPTLIMMHATGFLPWLWHPIARQLNEHYRIICPYFCDHREADPEKGGFDWVRLSEDLITLCHSLDIRRPFMVGHSMGGAVMGIAVGRFGMDAAGMVLIEPILLPREFYAIQLRVEEHPLAGKSIKRRNHWENMAEARRYLNSKAFFRTWDEEMLDLYLTYGMVSSANGGLELACHPRKEAALFMGSMAYDPWPILPKIPCPVLVLEGEMTENKGVIDFKKIADTMPLGKHRVVPGAGHLIPMEKPGETIDMIQCFFSREDL
jgi:lipase